MPTATVDQLHGLTGNNKPVSTMSIKDFLTELLILILLVIACVLLSPLIIFRLIEKMYPDSEPKNGWQI